MKIPWTSSIMGIKDKVTVGLSNFPPFTTIQTIRSYNSTWVQARKLKLSMYVHLIIQSHQDSAIAEIFAEFQKLPRCFLLPDNVILERILHHTLLRIHPGHSLSKLIITQTPLNQFYMLHFCIFVVISLKLLAN